MFENNLNLDCPASLQVQQGCLSMSSWAGLSIPTPTLLSAKPWRVERAVPKQAPFHFPSFSQALRTVPGEGSGISSLLHP